VTETEALSGELLKGWRALSVPTSQSTKAKATKRNCKAPKAEVDVTETVMTRHGQRNLKLETTRRLGTH
jgi:hypothetical protein